MQSILKSRRPMHIFSRLLFSVFPPICDVFVAFVCAILFAQLLAPLFFASSFAFFPSRAVYVPSFPFTRSRINGRRFQFRIPSVLIHRNKVIFFLFFLTLIARMLHSAQPVRTTKDRTLSGGKEAEES